MKELSNKKISEMNKDELEFFIQEYKNKENERAANFLLHPYPRPCALFGNDSWDQFGVYDGRDRYRYLHAIDRLEKITEEHE